MPMSVTGFGCAGNWYEACRKPEYTPDQVGWLDEFESSPLSADALGYYKAIYGNEFNASAFDPTLLNYYWSHVPGRSSFTVTWICADCIFDEVEGPWLWAPNPVSAFNPSVVENYPGAAFCPDQGIVPWTQARTTCLKEVAEQDYEVYSIHFPGLFVRRYGTSLLDSYPVLREGIPDHTWTEVMRVSVIDDQQSVEGMVWYFNAQGTGVWLNTGKSLRIVGDDDQARHIWNIEPASCLQNAEFLVCKMCEIVMDAGYETVQLTQFANGYSLEIIDCRGAILPSGRNLWWDACPPAHTYLLRGIPPQPRFAPALVEQRSHSTHCVCDRSKDYINCDGNPDMAEVAPLSTPPPPPSAHLAAWDVHPGVNCYTGFGATTLDEFGVVQIGVADCKALCLELSQCEGFVVDTNREDNGRVTCYRVRGIQLGMCTSSAGFNMFTYVLLRQQ